MPEDKKKDKAITKADISQDIADLVNKYRQEGESFADAHERIFLTLMNQIKATNEVTDNAVADIGDNIKKQYMLAGNLISLKQLEKALRDTLGVDETALDDDKYFKRLERLIMIRAMANMFSDNRQDGANSDLKVAIAKLEAKLEALTNQPKANNDKEELLAYIDNRFNQLLTEMRASQQNEGSKDGLDKLREAKQTIEEYSKLMQDLGISGEEAEKWKEEAISKLIGTIGKVGAEISDKISQQQLPPPPSLQPPPVPPTPPQPQPEILALLEKNVPFTLVDGSVVVPVANKNVVNALGEIAKQGVKSTYAGYEVLIFTGELAQKVNQIIQAL